MSGVLDPQRTAYDDDGASRPVAVWQLPPGTIAVSSAVLGGGLGPREWVANAQVDVDYAHADPAAHVAAIACSLDLDPARGVGLLTAAPVLDMNAAVDGGVECAATVGIATPTWAAAEDGAWSRWAPGTINLVCWVPAPLSEAALVNAVVTVTEAKAQALGEAGVPGTGTASDAVVVCCPSGGTELYGGPRSQWGARLARAVHGAVAAGAASYVARRR
ncbi:MAG: adenosylcobinamide hydrolase [Acidimicrobiaceae bacterium]